MDDAERQSALYRGVWEADPKYGTAHADVVDTVVHRIGPHIMRACGVAPAWIADFGAGDGRFLRELQRAGLCHLAVGVDVHAPTPIPQNMLWDRRPLWESDVTADYVISTDTLEHMPTCKVHEVLQRIAQCAPHGFLRISTKQDVYGTDRGLHLHETVYPPEWWLQHCWLNGIKPTSWRIYPDSAIEVWF